MTDGPTPEDPTTPASLRLESMDGAPPTITDVLDELVEAPLDVPVIVELAGEELVEHEPLDHDRGIAMPPAASAPDPAVLIQGHLESVVHGRIAGWVTLKEHGVDRPLPRVRVITDSGDVLAEGIASDFRQDVFDAGRGTGWCGFDFEAHLPPLTGVEELLLEVETSGGWRVASQAPLAEDEITGRLAPVSLLATFADATVSGGTVTSDGLRFGAGIWIQAASGVTGRLSGSLQLAGSSVHDVLNRLPVLRLAATEPVQGRVDVRFKLGDHAPHVTGGWVAIRVFGRSAAQQPIRLNLRDHRGRTALGDFVVRSHQWSTFQVQVPAHRCATRETTDDDATIWLEVITDAATSIDLQAPELIERDDADEFESLSVQTQRGVLMDVQEPLPTTGTPFSVVIPFYGKAAYTAACALSVQRCSWAQTDVVVVDDGSPHALSARRLLAQLPAPVRIVRSDVNRGYTASVNAGVQAAAHDVVVILNNDTRVTPGWDAPLIAALADPGVFAAGPLSNAASYQSVPALRTDGGWAVNEFDPAVAPDALAAALRARFPGTLVPLSILNGFCYAVRREDFLRLGGLDEDAFPSGYGEEVDLMLRARKAGMRNVVTPASFVYHYKSVTFGAQRSELSRQGNTVVRERWGARLDEAVREMDDQPDFDVVRAAVSALLVDLASGGLDG
ncbi:MAG: glycosyltransferase [Frankiaceae bacterium]|nr:glycosyltransferase [Frankiaceae bacterium]